MNSRGEGRPTVRDDAVFRGVGHEWVVYDPEHRKLHVLNATAALVWTLCDGTHDPTMIARIVADTLEGAPHYDRVLDDVRDVIRTFDGDGLLK